MLWSFNKRPDALTAPGKFRRAALSNLPPGQTNRRVGDGAVPNSDDSKDAQQAENSEHCAEYNAAQ